MAEQVRRLGLLVSIGFTVIALALGYWQVLRAESVLERPGNPRGIERERRYLRGSILDRNGEVLAESKREGEFAVRSYTYPPLAHVTGYVSPRYGKTGIEEAYDSYLNGERASDALAVLRNHLLPTRQQRGTNVSLTLDLRLQRVADQALGDNRGAVVALDVRTGEILAMASHPSFDPASVDQDWERLVEDPASPLVHRALQGQYVPGSIFKVITAAAALDLGIVQGDPQTRHRHEADIIVDGFRIRNTNHPQLTELSFDEEFAWSCNVAFALTGLSLGTQRLDFTGVAPREPFFWVPTDISPSVRRLQEYANRFYVGRSIPLELPNAAGRLAESERLTPVELATTSFGQGNLQVTPLQMALTAASVVTGGQLPAPYLVSGASDDRGTIDFAPPRPLGRVMAQRAASRLNDMMMLSVDTAYAQPARIPGVRVGGKTGTAEVGGGGVPHAWFIGYAPADRPGVAVAVIMENKGSGTQFATPVAQQVMAAALRLGY